MPYGVYLLIGDLGMYLVRADTITNLHSTPFAQSAAFYRLYYYGNNIVERRS